MADTITGVFELGGRGDLAELVRPTARRRAGMTEAGDVPATDAANGGAKVTPANGATAPAAPPAQPGAPLGGLKLTPVGPEAEIAAPKPATK